MHLGRNQLDLLLKLGPTMALVVPSKTSRRLTELGLLAAEEDGSFARITPAGLRALADAADAGKIAIPSPMSAFRSTTQEQNVPLSEVGADQNRPPEGKDQ